MILIKGYVYLIENKINNKKYIGKTYDTLANRWREHKQERNRSTHRPLYRAMNKYGVENFSIIEIEYCENCEKREQYWINYYDSFRNGYNATIGGDGRSYFEYIDEEIISYFLKCKTVSETAKYFECDVDTIRKRLRNNDIDIPTGGNIHSLKRNWKTRKIEQYNLNEEYIQSFESCLEAARWIFENGYSKGQLKSIVSNISKNCRGVENRKQAYQFIWRSKDE